MVFLTFTRPKKLFLVHLFYEENDSVFYFYFYDIPKHSLNNFEIYDNL